MKSPTLLWPSISGPCHILIACQPKSASTFLSTALGNLPKCQTVSLVPAFGHREQELCEDRLRHYRFRGNRILASQHHLCYSDYTGMLIRKYKIKPVVLVRNLFDAIASNRDHVRKEDVVAPMFHMTQDMTTCSDDELDLFLATFAIPWYNKFYLSWRQFPDALRLDYTDVTRFPEETLNRIIELSGHSFASAEIQSALKTDKAKTRFNHGQPGRGATISDAAKRAVRQQVEFYARYFPDPYLLQHLD
jgi:hypothetical protein